LNIHQDKALIGAYSQLVPPGLEQIIDLADIRRYIDKLERLTIRKILCQPTIQGSQPNGFANLDKEVERIIVVQFLAANNGYALVGQYPFVTVGILTNVVNDGTLQLVVGIPKDSHDRVRLFARLFAGLVPNPEAEGIVAKYPGYALGQWNDFGDCVVLVHLCLDFLEYVQILVPFHVEQIGLLFLVDAPNVTTGSLRNGIQAAVHHGTAVTGIGPVIPELVSVVIGQAIPCSEPDQPTLVLNNARNGTVRQSILVGEVLQITDQVTSQGDERACKQYDKRKDTSGLHGLVSISVFWKRRLVKILKMRHKARLGVQFQPIFEFSQPF
jgi:hypothetical protein